MTFNRTIFPPHLFVYDDMLIYKKRSLLRTREMSIAYTQISQVMLIKGIFFGYLEIITTGVEHINIKFVSKTLADRAKKIIDQKVYFAHAKHKAPDSDEVKGNLSAVEKSLMRYKELLEKGTITKRQFEKKTLELLKGF